MNEKPQYTFCCKAGEVIKNNLDKKQLTKFGRFFSTYCKYMKAVGDIENREIRIRLMQMVKKFGKEQCAALFNDPKFPKRLESHAQNAYATIYRKHLRNEYK